MKKRNQTSLIILTCLFWVVVFITLAINKINFRGCEPMAQTREVIVGGKRLCESFVSNSISFYIAKGAISAIAFLIVNFIYSVFVWKNVLPKLNHGFERFVLAIILICLVGLSIFPYGYVKYPIHESFARTMFVLMGIFSGLIFLDRKYAKPIRIASLLFVFYAIFCGAIFLFSQTFFWEFNLIFETLYLGYFSILILVIAKKSSTKTIVVK